MSDDDNLKIINVMTTADVMARLKVSRKTLYALIAKHLPNAARVGRDFRFIEEDIQTIWNGMRSGRDGYGGERPVSRSTIRSPHVGRSITLEQLLAKKSKKRK